MKRLENIEGAIRLMFQDHEKKIFEKSLKVFKKEFQKGNENLSFDELMRKPVSDEENDEYDVPTVEEQLRFYIGKIIYKDVIEPEIRHIDDNRLLEILDEKGYGCLFPWQNSISENYIEKIFNEIREVEKNAK